MHSRVLVLRRGFVGVDKGRFSLPGRGVVGVGAQRVVQVGHPLAVLGGDRQRLAEAQREGIDQPRLPGPAFALVGDQQGRFAHRAQAPRQFGIDGGRSGPTSSVTEPPHAGQSISYGTRAAVINIRGP